MKIKSCIYFFLACYIGTLLRVFINNNLVGTKIIGAPYFNKDSIIVGEDEGINGGICNVVYYDKVVTKSEIELNYN